MYLKNLFLFLFLSQNILAQQLVPYQVQDFKKWDIHAPWGYKDKNFNIVIQPINEAPNLFKNGYCVLDKNGKNGLIDSKGNVVIQPIFESCSDVEGDVVELKDSVLPFKGFYNIEGDKPNYFLNIKTNKKAFLNEKPNNSKIYVKSVQSGVAGLFLVSYYDNASNSSSYGLKNFKNEDMLPSIYKYIDKADEDILRVKTKDGLYGFIDVKKWIVQPTYDYLERFEDGIALAKKNNKWGYINTLGKEFIPLKYEKAHNFKNGYADVTYNAELFIIDKAGKTLFKSANIKYLENVFNEIFIIKNKNDSSYIVDKNGITQSIGANKIVSFDGENFVFLIGKSAYAWYKKTLTHISLKNVDEIYAYKMGLYIIDCKGEKDEKINISIFNNQNHIIADQEIFLKYRNHEDFGLLEAYWEVIKPTQGWENDIIHNVYTYISTSGKTYSDITK